MLSFSVLFDSIKAKPSSLIDLLFLLQRLILQYLHIFDLQLLLLFYQCLFKLLLNNLGCWFFTMLFYYSTIPIVWLEIAKMPHRQISAQFVCPSPKVSNFWKKALSGCPLFVLQSINYWLGLYIPCAVGSWTWVMHLTRHEIIKSK